MKMKIYKLSLIALTAISGTAANAAEDKIISQGKDNDAIISISFENDIITNEDNNYTNGFRIAYLSPETVPYWLEKSANFMPLINSSGNKRWGFALGQNIYTPDDPLLNPPNPTDQPYAGWLYGTAMLISDNDTTLDTFQLTLGIVGPSSLADETQDTVHRTFGFARPQGWDYQLKDEPGIVVSYDRKYRNIYQSQTFGLDFDITPNIATNLGNVDTSANIGAIARLGQDLPSDYGPPLIRPSLSGSDFFHPQKDFGWYIFGGLDGRAVARNIFLDGNTFRDSPSVDKEILVGGLQAGIAFTFKEVRISYTHVKRTDQFKGQKEPDEYGALTLSFRL